MKLADVARGAARVTGVIRNPLLERVPRSAAPEQRLSSRYACGAVESVLHPHELIHRHHVVVHVEHDP